MAIGKILSDLLKEKNTTVTDLARDINIAPTTIYSIIDRDNMKIDITILLKICKSLDVDINIFYGDYLKNCKTNNNYSKSEIQIIQKYRELDGYGKKAVSDLLNTEYERCAAAPEINMTYSKLYADEGGVTKKETPADLPKISEFFDD